MELTWLGTAGFHLKTAEGAVILIDPFLSRPAAASPPLPIPLVALNPVDEILLTNGRFDHAMDVPALVEQTGAIVHASEAVCRSLAAHGLSAHRLQPLDFNHLKKIGSLHWRALRGHFSQVDSSPSLRARLRNEVLFQHIHNLEQAWPQGEAVIYHLEVEARTILHFGSTGWNEASLPSLAPDVLLLPIERSPQAAGNTVRLTELLRPKVIVPHHWDNYYPPLSEDVDLTLFQNIIKARLPQSKVYQPVLGQPVTLQNLLAP